jgi:hypothetical protein
LGRRTQKIKGSAKFLGKNSPNPTLAHQETQKQLEKHQLDMENQGITQETLQQEDQLQRNWHQAYREEEKYWKQKSRSLWLEAEDKNIGLFHKQA